MEKMVTISLDEYNEMQREIENLNKKLIKSIRYYSNWEGTVIYYGEDVEIEAIDSLQKRNEECEKLNEECEKLKEECEKLKEEVISLKQKNLSRWKLFLNLNGNSDGKE